MVIRAMQPVGIKGLIDALFQHRQSSYKKAFFKHDMFPTSGTSAEEMIHKHMYLIAEMTTDTPAGKQASARLIFATG